MEEAILNELIEIDKKFDKHIQETNEQIEKVNNEIKNINEKIDIFYASDVLNKEILNDHEGRIKEIAIAVEIERDKKEEDIKIKNSIEKRLNTRLKYEESLRKLKAPLL